MSQPVKIKNGTEFIINNERWMYIGYIFKLHMLVACDKTELVEFKRNDGTVFYTRKTVDKFLNNEEIKKL